MPERNSIDFEKTNHGIFPRGGGEIQTGSSTSRIRNMDWRRKEVSERILINFEKGLIKKYVTGGGELQTGCSTNFNKK